MKKIFIAGAALAMLTGSAMAQSSMAPTSSDRTVGAVGSERGNNANSLNGTNAASGTYSGANAPSNVDNGRTSGGGGGGAGGGAGAGGAGAGGAGGGGGGGAGGGN